ncbi:hypothetical protein MRX96_027052 [Rhipicephalus microplus]
MSCPSYVSLLLLEQFLVCSSNLASSTSKAPEAPPWLPHDSGHVDPGCCEVPQVVVEEKAEIAVALCFTRAIHHLPGRKRTF